MLGSSKYFTVYYNSLSARNFKKMGQPWPLFFPLYVQKIILVVSRIQTWIVGIEGEDADH